MKNFRPTFTALMLGFLANLPARGADPLVLSPVPPSFPASAQADWNGRRTQLQHRWDEFLGHQATFASTFAGTKVGTPQADAALRRKQELTLEANAIVEDADRFNEELARLAALPPESQSVITDMQLLARQLGWDGPKQARLSRALLALAGDGVDTTAEVVQQTWTAMQARGGDATLVDEAARGAGPRLSDAGQQTSYEDCAIFALANAASLPYGVVAARATKLMGEGNWRSASARRDPQSAIENAGLNGGEVIMLAEVFGRSEVVDRHAFARTLQEGRPVMVNVIPRGGSGAHEVVLTRTFAHGGETWFEMIESNQPVGHHLYLSERELGVILQERGVAFRPEPGSTVPSLK